MLSGEGSLEWKTGEGSLESLHLLGERESSLMDLLLGVGSVKREDEESFDKVEYVDAE